MSYLLNYKKWRAVHEAAIFEALDVFGGSAVLPPLTSEDSAILEKFLARGGNFKTVIVEALTNYKILFTCDAGTAADYLIVGFLKLFFGRAGKYKRYANREAKFDKDADVILTEIESKINANFGPEGIAAWAMEEITLNQGKDPKTGQLAEGQVLARGSITIGGGIEGANNQLISTVDLAKYLNTYNLSHHPKIVNGKDSGYSSVPIDKNGAVNLRDGFETNVGADIDLYALADYTPPKSGTVTKYVPPFTITSPGAQTIAEVKNAFEVLDVVPIDAKIREVQDFIQNIDDTGSKISKIEIIGGASTEAVSGATQAAWATKYGVAADTLPPDNVINGTGTAGKVTDPKASGNAWLASERAKRFAERLSRSTPLMDGVTPVISAEIGTDAANSRFVKIVFEVQAKDTGTVVPGKWLVDTIATIASSNDLGGGFKLKRYYPDLW